MFSVYNFDIPRVLKGNYSVWYNYFLPTYRKLHGLISKIEFLGGRLLLYWDSFKYHGVFIIGSASSSTDLQTDLIVKASKYDICQPLFQLNSIVYLRAHLEAHIYCHFFSDRVNF